MNIFIVAKKMSSEMATCVITGCTEIVLCSRTEGEEALCRRHLCERICCKCYHEGHCDTAVLPQAPNLLSNICRDRSCSIDRPCAMCGKIPSNINECYINKTRIVCGPCFAQMSPSSKGRQSSFNYTDPTSAPPTLCINLHQLRRDSVPTDTPLPLTSPPACYKTL